MSLLLDALKRAEQEKLARQGQASAAEEPQPAPAGAGKRSLELESVDTPAEKSATPSADRQGARAVFAAKQPALEPPREAGKGNKAILAIVGVAVLALLAGGAYVWYEINKSPSPIALAPMAPSPVKPAPVAAAVAEGKAAEATTGDAKGDGVPPVSTLKPGEVGAKSKPQPKAAEQLVMSLLKDSPRAAKAAPPLKLAKTIDPPRIAPEVSQGYEALRSGDLETARKAYQSAVAKDATSLDAHLGLATVAARAGDRATATRHYRRALELDPKNVSAVAGLAALADFSRPDSLEAQLRADLTRYPQSAALQYTLGNLYAAQGRWNEAQAAYFEAYRLDPEAADVAYNLAVSLDHLGQSRLAADFYQRALTASRQQSVQFDKGQVSRRLAELKP
ncbi:MAG: tetratricopeptide repeat protein [Betaproteobacteria bacterium]|nr:tetratricopeptide repeat protein [Betaproteobacteria bacterium]